MVLGACARSPVYQANHTQPAGSTFDQALFSEYLALSNAEYDEADYADAKAFASRALMASEMKRFAPEEMSARQIPAESVAELKSERSRLVRVLASGGIEKAPKPAAKAQAMFDCWMQEQEENIQPEDIKACRAQFLTAMSEVELALRPEPKVAPMPAPKPAPKPAPAPKPVVLPGPFTIFFEFNSAALDASAKNAVAAAADAIAKAKPAAVYVTGHADRAGTVAYNKVLSRKRVDAVANAVVAAGAIDSASIVRAAVGESDPRIKTPDGKREAANRRVTVELK